MADTTQKSTGFLGGWGLGLFVIPLAAVFGAAFGPIAGWTSFAALAVGAATLPPFNGRRAGGVAAGILTVAGAGYGLLMALFAMMGDF